MPLSEIFHLLSSGQHHFGGEKLQDRLWEVFRETWHLGLTAFGGPPAHFRIFWDKFVKQQPGKTPWISEQTYQELFALCQSLPGPASTKFLYLVSTVHAGWVPGIMAFMLWALPGALGMFGLSLGVQQMSETLPDPVYALLSGLNASTVGIIAVSAVDLAAKCIKDDLTRILVIFGACAGLCYSALWYYPVLVFAGGLSTLAWDIWLGRNVRKLKQKLQRRAKSNASDTTPVDRETGQNNIELTTTVQTEESSALDTDENRSSSNFIQRRPQATGGANIRKEASLQERSGDENQSQSDINFSVSLKVGAIIMGGFVILFAVTMALRAQLPDPPLPLLLFANMLLAGTIIFGGGPVVIPLLREYVVTPGWVSPRDFLIGLAIIQAFPGPNFNFSVFLGALTIAGASQTVDAGASLYGALIAFAGIFLPGLVFTLFIQSVWKRLRSKPVFLALLRGINATAVGLVFTAVYRLWQVGYLTKESTTSNSPVGGRVAGRSLGDEPWFVVVATLSYSTNQWFRTPAAASITMGGVLGLAWWGATQQ